MKLLFLRIVAPVHIIRIPLHEYRSFYEAFWQHGHTSNTFPATGKVADIKIGYDIIEIHPQSRYIFKCDV